MANMVGFAAFPSLSPLFTSAPIAQKQPQAIIKGHSSAPIKFYLQKQGAAPIWPSCLSLLPPDIGLFSLKDPSDSYF